MRIACVKCSTLYELDDRLIPPGGAPVQCTRCGTVFTATSGAAGKLMPPEPSPMPQPSAVAVQPSPEPRSGTQIFGAVKTEAPVLGRSSGAATAPAPSEGARAATQIFGAQLGQALAGKNNSPVVGGTSSPVATFSSSRSTAPRPAAQRAPVLNASAGTRAPDPMTGRVTGGTMIFGQPFAAPEARAPVTDPAFVAPLAAPRSAAAAGEVAAAPAREPATTLKLPPEEPPWAAGRSQRAGVSLELPDAKPLFDTEAPDSTAVPMEMQASGTRRALVVALVVIGVGIPSGLAVRSVLKRRSSVPVEVLRGEENALTLLRRDDRPSRKQAIADLDSLAKKYPSSANAAATRLLALSLDLDDVRLAANRLQSRSDELNRLISRAQDQRTGEGASQVAAAQNQLAVVTKEMQPVLDEQKTLDQQVATAFGALMTISAARRGDDEAGAIRAQAIYYGVKGVDKAEALARRYREVGPKDGWDAVALAEYAVNAQVATALIAEARADSERSRSADSAFLRLYVLAARLALLQKDYDGASSLLEAVAALNPGHQMARELSSWVDEAKRNEAARSAQAVGDPSTRRQ